jgi:tetratricopeptide (TPR) repeat protein
LSEVGRRQEALAPTEEAVKTYRELAKTNPAYLGDLATALNNLGVHYSNLGRRQEALAPAEEAVKIRRELAKPNAAYLGDLAMALNNLGLWYSNLGRRQEALAPTEEAVKTYRELAKINPAFQGDLAMSLNNLGDLYGELGRRHEALAPAEEAVKTYRELAKSNPAYLSFLAVSLSTLGIVQLAQGEPEQARASYEASLTIIRPLAAANPAFQEELQRILNNLKELNRQEGIRTGDRLLGASDLTYFPRTDPTATVKRAVVRLVPTFGGQKPGVLYGTGFVVKRQGDRAWIATALHVVRYPGHDGLAKTVEAELFTGPLPAGVVPPRLEVVLPPAPSLPTGGEDLIVFEVRGLPPDVQPLPLTAAEPAGTLRVVGHPGNKLWAVEPFAVLKANARQIVLDGALEPGASGSPVLNASGQVLGLVYQTTTYSSDPLALVSAYRTGLIQAKLP